MKIKIFTLLVTFFVLINSVSARAATNSTAPTNLVVDFDNTAVPSEMHAGDSGILNLVIANTGGYRAENVEVYLTNAQVLDSEKRFYVGTLNAGQSKTLSVPLKVKDKATTGLKTIRVTLDYDGYDADGSRDNNKETIWEIPVTVYGSPNFEIDVSKTTYYKDTLDTLTLSGFTRDSVKDMTATVSSTCITFMGSSRKYIGDIEADETFTTTFDIKPTSAGACQITLTLSYNDESGASASDTVTLGLNIEAAGVDFKILNVSYDPTGPGETVKVSVRLRNVGKARAEDTAVGLSLSEPFVPVDTTERYIGAVEGGGIVESEFDLSVGLDAEIQPYSIPLNISYKVGGSSYSVLKDIGIDVTGKVILEVINVDTSRGLQIEVANLGTRTAEGVKAILTLEGSGNQTFTQPNRSMQSGAHQGAAQRQPQNPMRMMTGRGMRPQRDMTQPTAGGGASTAAGGSLMLIEYKSDIKPTKQTTFTFDTSISDQAILTLEYTGLNNERVTQTERLTIGSGGMSSHIAAFSRGGSGTSTNTYIIYGFVALLVLWIIYRKRKRKNLLPDFVARKIKRT